jgi:hypothetical protein
MSEPAIVVQELHESVGTSFCLGPLSCTWPPLLPCFRLPPIAPYGLGSTHPQRWRAMTERRFQRPRPAFPEVSDSALVCSDERDAIC